MSQKPRKQDADLLYGLAAIGTHLGLTARQAEHLCARGDLPSFKLGATVCARRSELDARVCADRAGPDAKLVQSSAVSQLGQSDRSCSDKPCLLYGHRAIAAHLGVPAADVERLDLGRRLPTYQDDGCTVASTAALDHWNSLKGGR